MKTISSSSSFKCRIPTTTTSRPSSSSLRIFPLLALLFVLLLFNNNIQSVNASSSDTDTTTNNNNTLISLEYLENLILKLRPNKDDDYYLIRVEEPTDKTKHAQEEYCSSTILQSLVTTLIDDKNINLQYGDGIQKILHIRGEICHILYLCSTYNQHNKQLIGKVLNGSVYTGITNVINDSLRQYNNTRFILHTDIIAKAAEAVYVLSFNNIHNQIGFYNSGTVDSLLLFILNCPIRINDNDNNIDDNNNMMMMMSKNYYHNNNNWQCTKAVMWSLAALQNLVATYCVSPSSTTNKNNKNNKDGTCLWKWTANDEFVLIKSLSKNRSSSNKIRNHILMYLQRTQLSGLIINYVCNGPIHQRHSIDGSSNDDGGSNNDGKKDNIINNNKYYNYAWPTLTRIQLPRRQQQQEEEQSTTHTTITPMNPSIVPWASIGFVKNLILLPAIREYWQDSEELFTCLCKVAFHSPDWLEIVQAQDALYNFGWADSCPGVYDFGCRNIAGWYYLGTNEDCTDFETERYCAEWGDIKNENGISANEACCFCGGGIYD